MTRAGRGRPLRFLAVVALGWTGARVLLLWPEAEPVVEAEASVARIDRAAPIPAPQQARTTTVSRPGLAADPVPPPVRWAGIRRMPLGPAQPPPAELLSAKPPGVAAQPPAAAPAEPEPAVLPPLLPDRLAPLPDRWSASGWIVVRPGTGIGAAPGGGQIGGGQAGVRIAWTALPRARVAAVARFAAPLAGKGREAALGVEWQPSRLPIRLVGERRFGLDGTPGGTGLGVIAGADARLPAGFRLESYAQAGAVRRSRTEPYADGAARILRPVAVHGRLALGVGAWGAAQRDAARLDIGPSAALALPVAVAPLRLSLDWRQRIAGDARPGSGPALTLGGDF